VSTSGIEEKAASNQPVKLSKQTLKRFHAKMELFFIKYEQEDSGEAPLDNDYGPGDIGPPVYLFTRENLNPGQLEIELVTSKSIGEDDADDSVSRLLYLDAEEKTDDEMEEMYSMKRPRLDHDVVERVINETFGDCVELEEGEDVTMFPDVVIDDVIEVGSDEEEEDMGVGKAFTAVVNHFRVKKEEEE
jgi:hypothetical protein